MRLRLLAATLAAALAVAATLLLSAYAQKGDAGGAPPQPGKKLAAGPLASLGLNDTQQAAINAALISLKQQMGALQKDTTLSEADRGAQAQAILKSTQDRVLAVLTPDQQQTFLQMGGLPGFMKGGGGPGGTPADVLGKLGLSDAQEAAVSTALHSLKKGTGDLQANAALSKAERSARMQALLQSTQDRILSALTEQQRVTFLKMGGMKALFLKGRPQGEGPGPVVEKLGLTADQRPRIEGVLATLKQHTAALARDASLPQERKFAQADAFTREAESSILSLLTPQQQETFQKLGGMKGLLLGSGPRKGEGKGPTSPQPGGEGKSKQ